MRNESQKTPDLLRRLLQYGELRITVIYLVFGSLWILLTDRLLFLLVQSRELQEKLALYKGWVFVAGTALLYYVLLRLEGGRRRKAETDLLALNAELEKRVNERTADLEAFSYTVSHDLRAPLRAIKGFSEILGKDYAGKLDAEGLRLLSVINKNIQRQVRLIDAVLAFSRASQADLAKAEVEMRALAQEAWSEAAPEENAPRFELGQLPPAAGDKDMLKQVWVNLLSNAVKFTANTVKPEITVSAKAEGGFSVYTVRDNGAGFDPAYGDRLFTLFERLHTQEEFKGSGLGLAIASRVIARHGGRVWAEGEPGKGAAFHFSLPGIK